MFPIPSDNPSAAPAGPRFPGDRPGLPAHRSPAGRPTNRLLPVSPAAGPALEAPEGNKRETPLPLPAPGEGQTRRRQGMFAPSAPVCQRFSRPPPGTSRGGAGPTGKVLEKRSAGWRCSRRIPSPGKTRGAAKTTPAGSAGMRRRGSGSSSGRRESKARPSPVEERVLCGHVPAIAQAGRLSRRFARPP